MAIQDAISFIKSKAFNDLQYLFEHEVSYCWQEETPDEVRASRAGTIIRRANEEIKKAKEKYRSKVAENSNSSIL